LLVRLRKLKALDLVKALPQLPATGARRAGRARVSGEPSERRLDAPEHARRIMGPERLTFAGLTRVNDSFI